MPRKLPAIMFFILIFLGFSDDVKSEYQSTRDSVIGLHVREADNGVKNVFWYECGKKLNRKESEVRASEYANAIMLSVEDVYRKTGEFINPDHVVAVLFRESSHNTCVIGKKESDLLLKKMKEIDESAVLKKDDFSVYVKKWEQEKIAAEKWCTSKGLRGSADCIDKMIAERVPEYSGIHAWDIGVAQFRYPGTRLFKRGVVLPNGKFIDKITVSDLLDYDVSIQLLVEDLAFFKKECRNHEHWLTSERGDKIRKLDVEEAYFVHHHTGVKSWSSKYWYAIEGHLSRINKMKEILSSVLSSVLFPIRMFG